MTADKDIEAIMPMAKLMANVLENGNETVWKEYLSLAQGLYDIAITAHTATLLPQLTAIHSKAIDNKTYLIAANDLGLLIQAMLSASEKTGG